MFDNFFIGSNPQKLGRQDLYINLGRTFKEWWPIHNMGHLHTVPQLLVVWHPLSFSRAMNSQADWGEHRWRIVSLGQRDKCWKNQIHEGFLDAYELCDAKRKIMQEILWAIIEETMWSKRTYNSNKRNHASTSHPYTRPNTSSGTSVHNCPPKLRKRRTSCGRAKDVSNVGRFTFNQDIQLQLAPMTSPLPTIINFWLGTMWTKSKLVEPTISPNLHLLTWNLWHLWAMQHPAWVQQSLKWTLPMMKILLPQFLACYCKF